MSKERRGSPESATDVALRHESNRRLSAWNKLMFWGFGVSLVSIGIAAILASGGSAAPAVVKALSLLSGVSFGLGTVGAGGGIAENLSRRK